MLFDDKQETRFFVLAIVLNFIFFMPPLGFHTPLVGVLTFFQYMAYMMLWIWGVVFGSKHRWERACGVLVQLVISHWMLRQGNRI